MRPRVLIIVQNLPVPFDRRVWLECNTLRDAGYDVTVICPRGKDTGRYQVVDDVEIHGYRPWAPGGGAAGFVLEYIWSFVATAWLALRARRRGPFDVVQACNPPDIFWPLARWFRLRDGSRFVFDHHDLCPELYRSRFPEGARLPLRGLLLLERMTFRTADRVTSTNESYAAVARTRGRKPADAVTVVRTGPDPDRLRAGEPLPHLRRGHDHLVAYLGVMGPQDGIDHALRALAALKERRADWHAVFVGEGDVLAAMKLLAGELGLAGDVEFAGRLPDEDVQRILSTADVCLAPDPKNPLNDVSTMNKILEYMAMSRPVVAYDLVEARVSAGDAALYADANDESSFADRIDRLLDEPELRARLGSIGRARIEAGLSWDVSVQELVRAYDRALERRRSQPPS